jgi:hypothetical protein
MFGRDGGFPTPSCAVALENKALENKNPENEAFENELSGQKCVK